MKGTKKDGPKSVCPPTALKLPFASGDLGIPLPTAAKTLHHSVNAGKGFMAPT
jgi:hypothetical protein